MIIMEYILGIVVIAFVVFLIVKRRKVKKTPTGIQVYSGNGKLQLNYTDGMCRVYGWFQINGTDGSRTVNIPDNEIGRLFVIPVVSPKHYRYSDALGDQYVFLVPEIHISGKTISWNFAHYNLGKKVHLDYSDTVVYFVYGTW